MNNRLTIKRFNGEEVYGIGAAVIRFTEIQGKSFCKLKISSDAVINTLPDTANLKALPSAEILIPVPNSDKDCIKDKVFVLEKSYDAGLEEHLATLYYSEHQDLDNNEVSISLTGDNTYHVVWTAETTDINFYDGSKPKSQIFIEADFSLS